MRVIVDETRCVGCGLCEETLPALFEMGRYVARVKVRRIPDDAAEAVLETVSDCPAEALSVDTSASPEPEPPAT